MFNEDWEIECEVPVYVMTHTQCHSSAGLGMIQMENYFLLAKWTLKRYGNCLKDSKQGAVVGI